MRAFFILTGLVFICGAWPVLAPSQRTHPAQWAARVASAGGVQFFQAPAAQAWPSSTPGGTNRSHLANSAIPQTPPFFQCSVDTSDGPDPVCSVSGNKRCTALCNSGQACSAFFQGLGAKASCSTSGAGACSVLYPASTANAQSSCSAYGGGNTDVKCSVLRGGVSQFCSAENPTALPAFCSVNSGSPPPQQTTCSVLSDTPGAPSYCSVARPPGSFPKQCSAGGGPAGRCSIRMGIPGACTVFQGAPHGSCSVHGSSAPDCSVIGGPPGDLCRQ